MEVQPCSPNINMSQPNFSSRKTNEDDVRGLPATLFRGRDDSSSNGRLQLSASSFNASFDTDEELEQAHSSSLRPAAVLPDNLSQDYDPEDQGSNGSLSDSMTQRDFRNKQQHTLHPMKMKKHKKKNKFTQMISGASYKSKAELFQKLFKDTHSNENLIIDYSCAFHRDILVHGRLYLSQNWLCFYANIFGWETLITVQWSDITAITKEKTAKVIPNAIQVLTDNDKYFFTTFVTRENAYTALFRIWQNALLGQPMQPYELKSICKKYRQKKSSDTIEGELCNDLDETGDEVAEDDLPSIDGSNEQLNRLDEFTGETTSLAETNGSSPSPSYGSNTVPVIDDNENEGGEELNPVQNSAQNASSAQAISQIPNIVNENSEGGVKHTSVVSGVEGDPKEEPSKKSLSQQKSSRPFSKAQDLFRKKRKHKSHHHHHQRTHSIQLIVPEDPGETTTDFEEANSDASTDERIDEEILCPCHDSHKGKEYVNEEFNFDVDALYEHLFSQESDMMKLAFEERKHENWKYTPLEKDESGCDTQTLSYTLSLNYSIGPKTSDTISKQTFSKDNKPGSFYLISTINRSVGVPYSDSFHVSVQYCITRCSGNRSRLKVFGEVVYTKRVFGLVKNMISRNGEEAMRDYYVYLANLLRSESEVILSTSASLSKRKKLSKKIVKEPNKLNVVTRKKTSYGSSVPPSTATKTPQMSNSSSKSSFSTATLAGVIVVILLLFGMNIYLLRRLWTLESSVLVTRKTWNSKNIPADSKQWVDVLEHQKELHDLELMKLKEVIGNTALLMKQVEGSISALYSELDKGVESENVRTSEQQKQVESKNEL